MLRSTEVTRVETNCVELCRQDESKPSKSFTVRRVCQKTRSLAFESAWQPPPAWRSNVFQEFNTWPPLNSESSDAQSSAEDLIQVLLLNSVIITHARDFHAQPVAVKSQALIGVRNDNRGVINAQKHIISRALPLRITFARREPNDLEHVVLGITKIERFDSPRILVPFWQGLRRSGDLLDPVPAELFVGPIHVSHNDGDVLKPVIVAL